MKQTRQLFLVAVLMALLLSTQGCYTQLAWFHPPKPEPQIEEESTFDDYPYKLNYSYSDFDPFYSGSYGYDNLFRLGYGAWAYWNSYPSWLYGGYGYYPLWSTPYPSYGNGWSTTIDDKSSSKKKRDWDRRGSNLTIRRNDSSLNSQIRSPVRPYSPSAAKRSRKGRFDHSWSGHTETRNLDGSGAFRHSLNNNTSRVRYNGASPSRSRSVSRSASRPTPSSSSSTRTAKRD